MAAALPRFGVTASAPRPSPARPRRFVACSNRSRAAREAPDVRARRACCRRISRATSSTRSIRGAQPLRASFAHASAGVWAERAGLGGGRGRERRRNGLRRRRRPRARSNARRAGRRHRHACAGDRRRTRSDRLARRARPRVSLGHSGATYEEALAAIAAGARQATHLFNRMPPLGHRAARPGRRHPAERRSRGGVDLRRRVTCIPPMVRTAVAAKRPSRIMAITDGTAASGLPVGTRGVLGGQPITAGSRRPFSPTAPWPAAC